MIGVPLLIAGLLLVLSALAGAQVAGRRPGALATFVLSPLHPAAWYATLAILAGFWVEIFGFSIVAGALSSGVSTLVFGIGVVIIGIAIEVSRAVARLERRRAALIDGRPLLPHLYRPYGHGPRDLLVAVFLDPSRWRDVVYVFVAFPLAILEFTVVATLWVAALGLVSVPVWYAMGEWPGGIEGLVLADPRTSAVFAGMVGVVLLPVAASSARGLMTLHRAVISGLLCASERQVLERRVETLEVSRKAVLDAEATELRRIERDLHDGAQQRLVLLTINLGLAAERIDTDPGAAKGLVVDARDQARLALAEIRDLVRGIAPAILLDRGLVPALGSVAARWPVPTAVLSTIPEGERLPDAVERAAYFVITEALANTAKHAGATRCEIRCRVDGGRLVVELWDDGAGGAKVVPGGGLAGLAGRVEALDGTLIVTSPSGGPTLIRAEFPLPRTEPPLAPPAPLSPPPAPLAPPTPLAPPAPLSPPTPLSPPAPPVQEPR